MTFIKFTTRLIIGLLFVGSLDLGAQRLCSPDPDAPEITGCPTGIIELSIADPAACTLANPITPPGVIENCSFVAILNSIFISKFT